MSCIISCSFSFCNRLFFCFAPGFFFSLNKVAESTEKRSEAGEDLMGDDEREETATASVLCVPSEADRALGTFCCVCGIACGEEAAGSVEADEMAERGWMICSLSVGEECGRKRRIARWSGERLEEDEERVV